MRGQQSLSNFYQSVKFRNPELAKEIMGDVCQVELCALGRNKSEGQEAVNRLRQKALDMPVIHARVLDSALTELGYDLTA